MKIPLRKETAARCVTTALLLLVTLAPFMASAQTGDSSSPHDGWGWRSHQSSDLQQKISALPTTASPSVLMPVLFGVGTRDISPNFGDPRPGGRTHEGEDIMAVKGTPIVSPTPAVVVRVETGVSEGNAVYTANPGGETFVYMHLDRFAEGLVVGAVLQTGSLIGYVGNTGDAAGGAAHLHFEIHNTSGTPMNPFPRLTSEISLPDKITDLSMILGKSSDSTALAQLLVTNFRSTFTLAIASNIALPAPITSALASVPITATNTNGTISLPAGDLDVGSQGSLVVALQQYLIQANKGASAASLAKAGATGNFGPLTKAALAEYQLASGISPANGYYGPATKAYIDAHPIATLAAAPGTPASSDKTSTTVALSRNLSLSMSGDDVRALQKVLNARGFTIAATGSGSPGSETNYFGSATQAAVIKLQTALGIAPAAGFVGPLTRAALGSV